MVIYWMDMFQYMKVHRVQKMWDGAGKNSYKIDEQSEFHKHFWSYIKKDSPKIKKIKTEAAKH